MAKYTLVMFLVAALLASSQAFMPTTPRRALQQTFTCTQARALNGRCQELYSCVVGRQPSLRPLQGTIISMCNSCLAATRSCPANNALPSACASGLRFAPVATCIQAAIKATPKPTPKPSPKPSPRPTSG